MKDNNSYNAATKERKTESRGELKKLKFSA